MSEFYEPIRKGDDKEENPPVSWQMVQDGLYDEIKQINIVVKKSTCLISARQVLLFGCHLDSILLLDKEVNQSDDFNPFHRGC